MPFIPPQTSTVDTAQLSELGTSADQPIKRIFLKTPSMYKKRQSNRDARRPVFRNAYQYAESPLAVQKRPSSLTPENEFELFGRYIVNQLQLLPLEEALLVQEAMQRMVTRARLRTLRSSKEHMIEDPNMVPQAEDDNTDGHEQVLGEAEVIHYVSESKLNAGEAGMIN